MSAGFMIPAENVLTSEQYKRLGKDGASRRLGAVRKRSKYGNKKTMAGGVEHASKKQSLRWVLLRQWEREGKIKSLRREVPFLLEVNGQLVCKYVADHCYVQNGQGIVEDVKSPITRKNRAYRIKLKLMCAIHGIEILEV